MDDDEEAAGGTEGESAGSEDTVGTQGLPPKPEARSSIETAVGGAMPASEDLNETDHSRLRRIAAARHRRAREFHVHRLRPCRSIADENDEATGIHLIEEIRERAPWYGDALTIIERQLQLALWSGRS